MYNAVQNKCCLKCNAGSTGINLYCNFVCNPVYYGVMHTGILGKHPSFGNNIVLNIWSNVAFLLKCDHYFFLSVSNSYGIIVLFG